jgi:hypothetical protein
MKRKIWTIVSMALLSGAFVACSDDNDFDPNGNQTGTEDAGYSSYLTINVSMSESGSTRAIADDGSTSTTSGSAEGDITLKGEVNERTINTVNVYVFEAPVSGKTEWTLKENRAINAFTDGVEDATNNVYRFGSVAFKALLKNTTYRLYVVANGKAVTADYKEWTVGAEESNFLSTSRFVSVAKSSTAYSADNELKDEAGDSQSTVAPGFAVDESGLPKLSTFDSKGLIMASRQFEDMTTVQNVNTSYVEFTIGDDNSENNPELVTIAVERVMARLDLGLNNYDGALYIPNSESKQYATVTLTGYYPVNISKDSYLFRHRSANLTEDTPTYTYGNLTLNDNNYSVDNKNWSNVDYVVDPYTNSKKTYYPSEPTVAYATMYYNPLHKSTTATNKLVADRKMIDMPSSLTTIGYCLENTTIDIYQQKEYSTGLVIAGSVEPDIDHVFYNYNNVAYTYEDFKAAVKTWQSDASTAISNSGLTSTENKTAVDVVDEAITKATIAKTSAETAKDKVNDAFTAATNNTSGNTEVAAKMKPYHEAVIHAYEEAVKALTAATAAQTAAKAEGATAATIAEQLKIAADKAAEVADSVASVAKFTELLAAAAVYNNTTFDNSDAAKSAAGIASTDATTAQTAASKAQTAVATENAYNAASAALEALNVDKDGKYTGDTLYYYNYNFYTSILALGDVMVLPKGLNKYKEDGTEDVPTAANSKGNAQILSEYGATLYTRDNTAYRTAISASSTATEMPFVTYYLYVIKHYQYADATNSDARFMAPMKYAIVRNNVYQMTVSGVLALGSSSPDPTDPDPEDSYYPGPNPDDEQEVYLKMELQVRHWVVRDQGDIKLK